MGCKASEVSYVDQGSSIDGRVLRALGGTASSTVDLKRMLVFILQIVVIFLRSLN